MKSAATLLCASLLTVVATQSTFGLTVVYEENFNQVPLRPAVDESSNITQAFSHEPPDNWQINSQGVPGVGNPDVGVAEWEGWSFANKDFWIEVSEDERRSEFKRGQGTVAVADPDEWNDLGFPSIGGPANAIGFYNAFLATPQFDISTLREKGDRLKFRFDSSWIPECCDDGEVFDPNGNNKRASIRAIFEDGSSIDNLLRWESAPFTFTDASGNTRPSTDPNDDVNPFFKSTDTNELVYLDLSPLLSASQNHINFRLEFGLTNAGDDWWWAMDNMQMISMMAVPGDMDLDYDVDEDDIDDFAQAMHSTEAYRAAHYDELPAVRGSLDSTFDFDDIDWFVGVLNDWGVAASEATIIAAFEAQAVPEPSTGGLALLASCAGLVRFRNRR